MYRGDVAPKDVKAAVATIKTKRSSEDKEQEGKEEEEEVLRPNLTPNGVKYHLGGAGGRLAPAQAGSPDYILRAIRLKPALNHARRMGKPLAQRVKFETFERPHTSTLV